MNQISARLVELLLGSGDHAGNLGPLVGQRRHDVTFRHIHPRSQNDRADYLLQVDMMSAMRLVCMRHDTGFNGHKRVKGRKRHILVDILGLPITNWVEPANMSDRGLAGGCWQGSRRSGRPFVPSLLMR